RPRLDALEPRRADDRVERSGALGAFRAAGEEPVLAADGDVADSALDDVVVDGESAVLRRRPSGQAPRRTLPIEARAAVRPDRIGGCANGTDAVRRDPAE